MSRRARKIGALLAVVLVYAMIDASTRDAGPWWNEKEGASEDLDELVDGLFSTHVFAFEALGVLLTAAMIGAMIIARPMHGRPDSENYTTYTDEEIEETQRISEQGANQ